MKKKVNVRNLSLMALFAALTAVGAFITIPVPPVPFSLQIFFAILAGALLGSRQGAMSIVIYLLLGLCGLPVFTKGAGLSYLLQPTFGYLLGFVPAAWLCGKIIELCKSSNFRTLLVACFSAAGVDFAIGCGYYALITNLWLGKGMSAGAILYSTFLIFVPADTLLMVLAAFLGSRLLPILRRVDFPLSCLPCIFPQKGI